MIWIILLSHVFVTFAEVGDECNGSVAAGGKWCNGEKGECCDFGTCKLVADHGGDEGGACASQKKIGITIIIVTCSTLGVILLGLLAWWIRNMMKSQKNGPTGIQDETQLPKP